MDSITHADADGLCSKDEFAVRLDEAELVDGFLNGNGIDMVCLVGNHAAELFFLAEFHGHHAETHAEDAVERGGRSAALEVAEGGGTGFLASEFMEALGDALADAAEPDFAAAISVQCDDAFVRHFRTLGDDDECGVVALRITAADEGGDLIEVEGNFRDKDHARATRDTAPQRDPSGVATHDFQNHHALVGFGGGVESVEAINDGGDGAVETEGHRGGAEIVIDRFRHADDGPSGAVKLERGGERTIAAHHDERADFQPIHRVLRAGYDFLGHLRDIARADLGGEVTLVRAAEDRAAELEDADGVGGCQDTEITGREQPLEAVLEADDLPAELVRRADDAMDDRIKSGAIAAAVEDSDAHKTLNFKP